MVGTSPLQNLWLVFIRSRGRRDLSHARTVHAENGNYNLEGKFPETSPFDHLNQCEFVMRLDDVTDVYTKYKLMIL